MRKMHFPKLEKSALALSLATVVLPILSAFADFEVYFLRHGETTWNRAHVLQGSIANVRLTLRGERMAAETARGLAAAGVAFERVYASPYLRAWRTAEIVSRGLGVEKVIPDARLREMCFGSYEGMPYGKGRWPDDNFRRCHEDPERYVPTGPGAESYAQVQARLRDFLERELKPLDGKVTRVLCVAHSLVLKSLVQELAGESASPSAKKAMQRNCCVHVVRYSGGRFTLGETGRVYYDVRAFDQPAAASLCERAPDGSVWNARARRFVYAPFIAFTNVEGAVRYETEVVDDFHRAQRQPSVGPEIDLATCWDALPVGYVTASCRAFDADGRMKGGVQSRTFWKKAAFGGEYEPAKMSYALARTRMFDCFMNMKETRYLLENGRPDPSYPLNGYPSKMLSAVIVATVSQLESKGTIKDLAVADRPLLELARRAADHLIADAVPAGNPLAHFTRTYAKEGSEYGRFAGRQDHIMLNYPAEAGVAFLRLYRFGGERKYLEAAERIAGTFMSRQEADGTWPLRQNAVTGEVQGPNRLIPMDVIELMEGLYAVSGKEDFRRCADRAFAFVEKGPLRNWNWEAQFEDSPSYPKPYANLSNVPANKAVRYLLTRFRGDARRVAQAREILAFIEDQFVEWEPPYRHRRFPQEGMSPTDDGGWKWWCRPFDDWMTPCALEQYACYVPVNASSANCVASFLAMAKATGEGIWLDKARAIGDALTRMVEDDGFFNTWCVRGVSRFDERYHTWLNCTLETKTVLDQLAALP